MLKLRTSLIALALVAAPLVGLRAAESTAWLVQMEGPVELTAPSGGVTASVPMQLLPGTTVKTGDAATAVLQMNDGSHVQVSANSSFVFAEATDNDTIFSLLKGGVNFWVRPLQNRELHVRTPGAVAAVRGTEFGAWTDGRASRFDLYKGKLDLLDTLRQNVTRLREGYRAVASAAQGINKSATVKLPPNVSAPAEPPAVVLPVVTPAPAPAPAPQPAPEPAPSEAPAPEPAPAPAPPPPAQQQQTVVSPSSPH